MTDIVNPIDMERLIDRDELFALIFDEYGPPPNWSRPQGFISLSKIILEQKVSFLFCARRERPKNVYLIIK